MTTPRPMTAKAIEAACSADDAQKSPWARMTRHDAAVRAYSPTVYLHGTKYSLNLWRDIATICGKRPA